MATSGKPAIRSYLTVDERRRIARALRMIAAASREAAGGDPPAAFIESEVRAYRDRLFVEAQADERLAAEIERHDVKLERTPGQP